ncbi:MAG: hypothetical protein HWE34_04715 [Methylocystaceae bacterium]|nr:hypothetical protein [Methylocystaceae bacterium]
MINTFEHFHIFLEKIKRDGNIAIIKMDGLRKEKCITCLVSYPQSPESALRIESDSLEEVVKDLSAAYEKNVVSDE